MQYGNPFDRVFRIDVIDEFKSYYVVWKLISGWFATISCNEFKSYYVVWKLFLRGNCTHACVWFKSYYVVWKLKFNPIPFTDERSLNRTMQYGNFSFLAKANITLPGLNRTMQYGNLCKRKYNPTAIAFKSYYVVWKLLFSILQFFHNPSFKSYYVVWKLPAFARKENNKSGLNRTMQYGN